MVCCTLGSIKATNNIQDDIFILLFFCCLFCVYSMRFISMVIVKEIIFTYVIYAVTLCRTYQKQSLAIITDYYSVYDNEN